MNNLLWRHGNSFSLAYQTGTTTARHRYRIERPEYYVSGLCLPPALSRIPTPLKACEEEWKANKATIQGSGKKKQDFITECRAENPAAASPAPAAKAAPVEQPKPAAQAPQPTKQEPPKKTVVTAPPAKAPTKAGQFVTEAEAKAHCPADTVVWANTESDIYHYATSKSYAHTKAGAYMCEKETAAAGIRAAKNEKHP